MKRMKQTLCSQLIGLSLLLHLASPAGASGPKSLDALTPNALSHSPQLQACRQAFNAQQAELQAAGLWQNPRLEVDGEDFLGTAANKDYHQWTLSLSQAIPWGPRLDATRTALAAGLKIQAQDCALQALQVQLALGRHYLEALSATEQLAQWQAQVALAQDLLQRSERLLIAGKITRLEHQAPERMLAEIKRARDDAAAYQSSQLQLLQSYLPADMTVNAADLQAPPDLSTLAVPTHELQQLQALLQLHPTVQQAQLAVTAAQAWLAVEKERPWPDLAVASGLRWHPLSQDLGLNLRLGADLPVYHQNQTGVTAAEARLQQAHQHLIQVEQSQLRALLTLIQDWQQARRHASQLGNVLLPLALSEVKALETGWLSGSQNYTSLNWLQSRLRLQSLQQEHLVALQQSRLLALQLRVWLGEVKPR